ncbi:Fimh-like protein [hydrothermal vent metagenome]|uniref:Fimh-like protein n=1 Tax=hydrothermal vent metagenome TaxID=652676 RepID=A0A1W1EHR1_9ZZZZ
MIVRFSRLFMLMFILIYLTSCGNNSSCDTNIAVVNANKIGFLIDSPVGNIDYQCGDKQGKTDKNGKFECSILPVTFTIGNVVVLKSNIVPEDKKLYLQDIVGVDRDSFNNEDVLKVAMFLQSLDDDGDINEFIWIDENISNKFDRVIDLQDLSIAEVEDLIKKADKTPVTKKYAMEHLEGYILPNENNETNQTVVEVITPSENNETNQTVVEVITPSENNETNQTVVEVITPSENNETDETNISEAEATYPSSENNETNGTDALASEETNQTIEQEVSIDTTPPTITLIGESNITIEALNEYIDEGVETDDENATIIKQGDVNSSKVGTYIITYRAVDSSNNSSEANRTVIVVDTINPTITLNGNSAISITRGSTYNEQGAVATDNLDDNLSVEIIGEVNTNSNGTYTLIYSTKDSSNNEANTTRSIRVYTPAPPPDTTPPVITINGDNPVTIYKDSSYSDAGATTNEGSISKSGSVDSSTIGSYSITYSATDSSGNSATKTRTVRVISGKPILSNPTLNIDENATTSTLVGKVIVDSNGSSDITSYELNDTTNFSINANGEILTASTFDYESRNIYTIEANASNGVVSDSVVVTININDIAEVIPVLLDKNATTQVTNFTFSGDANWIDEGDNIYSSGDINDGQSSCIIYNTTGGVVSFDWNVSSEEDYDYLNLYIDNIKIDRISGEQSMASKSYEVSKEIKWCYSKDVSDKDGSDKAWIEDVKILEYYTIDENASIGDSVGFVGIKDINDSNISSFNIIGEGSESFEILATGEILLKSQIDYETKAIYHLSATATNEAGTSNSVDVNISIINDTNDLFIDIAVFDDNSTADNSDDRLNIYFTKDIDIDTVSTDSFNIYGDGLIDGVGVYSSSWFNYKINLSANSEVFTNDSNISISNSVDATDGYKLYYETTTKIEKINKFSRIQTGDTNNDTTNSDGDLKRGLSRSYVDNGDGTITDNNTALIWQKEDDNNTYTYSNAIGYCEDLDLGGSSEWRLPTIDELVSISDKGRVAPRINPIFTNTNSNDVYWSFSSYANNSSDAWTVDFGHSYDGDNDKDTDYLVRW